MSIRVFVYWNLNKGLWSVKALEGPQRGRIVARLDRVVLHNAYPKVSEAGRQRVLQEKRKNVHAGIVGHWQRGEPWNPGLVHYSLVSYNPYKGQYFYFKNFIDLDWHPDIVSPQVIMTTNKEVYVA